MKAKVVCTKDYLLNMFGVEDFDAWLENHKVFLGFPTGWGKSTLICDGLIPYCRKKGKKVLILCNRRLLKNQYDSELAERYKIFSEFEEDVSVVSYQKLAEVLRQHKTLKQYLADYEVIICDECHYFYSDSTYNGFGTYVLLQMIVKECFFKTVIFMTATGKEVKKLIFNVFEQVKSVIDKENDARINLTPYMLGKYNYDYEDFTNYDHIQCNYVEDIESLAEIVGNTDGKTVVFIDDKLIAKNFRELLIERGSVKSKEIFMLDADILEEYAENKVIKNIVYANKLVCKVLITTSVLDNGISLHDEEISNVIIATESRVSLVQMLGRFRTETSKKINLFFYPRSIDYYERRVTQYQEKIHLFNELKFKLYRADEIDVLFGMWYGETNESNFLRNATVVTHDNWQYLNNEFRPVKIKTDGIKIVINSFAKEYVGDMLLAEKNCLKLSYKSMKAVAIHQMCWINKKADELTVFQSTYKKELEEKLKKDLLSVVKMDLKSFSEKKVDIANKYFKTLFPEILFKGSSVENKKIEEVCNNFGFKLLIEQDRDGHNSYSIIEQ